MAASYSIFAYLAFFFLASNVCHSSNRKVLNALYSYDDNGSGWKNTIGTFYGDKDGPGSVGGACGYQTAVELGPYNSRIVAVEPSLFQGGAGCGSCFLITCKYPSCSGASVRVVATDLCPEGACTSNHLFDLSGASVEDLANPGEEDQLRQIGDINVQYKSIPCEFKGVDVTFRVDPGSSEEYFATAIEFENEGVIKGVDIKDASSTEWIPMSRSWGAVYKAQFTYHYVAPLSFRLTDQYGNSIEAINVIPLHYSVDTTYTSNVNFHN